MRKEIEKDRSGPVEWGQRHWEDSGQHWRDHKFEWPAGVVEAKWAKRRANEPINSGHADAKVNAGQHCDDFSHNGTMLLIQFASD